MRFLILMTNDDAAWDALPPAEQARVMAEHAACEEALRAGGRWQAWARRLRFIAGANEVREAWE